MAPRASGSPKERDRRRNREKQHVPGEGHRRPLVEMPKGPGPDCAISSALSQGSANNEGRCQKSPARSEDREWSLGEVRDVRKNPTNAKRDGDRRKRRPPPGQERSLSGKVGPSRRIAEFRSVLRQGKSLAGIGATGTFGHSSQPNGQRSERKESPQPASGGAMRHHRSHGFPRRDRLSRHDPRRAHPPGELARRRGERRRRGDCDRAVRRRAVPLRRPSTPAQAGRTSKGLRPPGPPLGHVTPRAGPTCGRVAPRRCRARSAATRRPRSFFVRPSRRHSPRRGPSSRP